MLTFYFVSNFLIYFHKDDSIFWAKSKSKVVLFLKILVSNVILPMKSRKLTLRIYVIWLQTLGHRSLAVKIMFNVVKCSLTHINWRVVIHHKKTIKSHKLLRYPNILSDVENLTFLVRQLDIALIPPYTTFKIYRSAQNNAVKSVMHRK